MCLPPPGLGGKREAEARGPGDGNLGRWGRRHPLRQREEVGGERWIRTHE